MSDDLTDCCGNDAWRGRLCAYHEGVEDGKAKAADEIERLAAQNFNLRSAMRAQLQPLADIATTIEQATR